MNSDDPWALRPHSAFPARCGSEFRRAIDLDMGSMAGRVEDMWKHMCKSGKIIGHDWKIMGKSDNVNNIRKDYKLQILANNMEGVSKQNWHMTNFLT